MWAVRVGSIELMKALGIHVSSIQHDVSLGGSINVSGRNLCMACFHGSSFRETEWAVFNVDHINTSFTTIAIPGANIDGFDKNVVVGKRRRICQHICNVSLGDSESRFRELAAVYRVSARRGGVPPFSPQEISEWLDYACIYHHIHSTSVEGGSGTSSSFFKFSQKLSIQPVISLPVFNVKLINDHFYLPLNVLEDPSAQVAESATVECSLFSKFVEGISITTTVDDYLFLHDLFKAYIEHLEKHKTSFRKSAIKLIICSMMLGSTVFVCLQNLSSDLVFFQVLHLLVAVFLLHPLPHPQHRATKRRQRCQTVRVNLSVSTGSSILTSTCSRRPSGRVEVSILI